jgi:transmembrane sensor
METRNFEDMFLGELEGTLSAEDRKALEEWVEENEDNRNEFNGFKSAWELSSRPGEMRRFSTAKASRAVKNRIPEFRKKIRFLDFFQKAAAILILPLLFGSIYTIHKQGQRTETAMVREISTNYGIRNKFNLPDGTTVWLNSGSRLRFPGTFSGQKREVYLVGEACFEVSKDATRPFYVNLGEISVKATGTTFNVSAYPGENTFETSLLSGKVDLVKTVSKRKEIVVCHMQPKQLAIFDKTDDHVEVKDESDEEAEMKNPATDKTADAQRIEPILPKAVSHNKHTSWITGKLVFRNDPMVEVIRQLGRWYNVDIRLQDTILYDFQYTATFENETLDQVLDLLVLSAPIEYSVLSRKAGNDYTYSKKLVTIRLRKQKNRP